MNSWLFAALALVAAGAVTVLRERRSPSRITPSLSDPEAVAHLLVTEIRKYHGKAVEHGRSELAIYRTLRDDIDRSREMFLKQFPESEEVFYSALVAILGGGEAGRLGSDYPHPKGVAATGSGTPMLRHGARGVKSPLDP